MYISSSADGVAMSIFNGFSKRLFGAFSQNYVGLSFRKKTLRGRVETMATSLSQKNLIFKSLCTLSGENFSRASKMAAIVGRLFHKKGRLALHARLGKKKIDTTAGHETAPINTC